MYLVQVKEEFYLFFCFQNLTVEVPPLAIHRGKAPCTYLPQVKLELSKIYSVQGVGLVFSFLSPDIKGCI